jgi:DNA-binding beta-propeller fold protein YncE
VTAGHRARRLVVLTVGAAVVGLMTAGPAAQAAGPAGPPGGSPPPFVQTLGGPGHAAMYPSGADVAPDGDVVVADTGNDFVTDYNPANCIGVTDPNQPPCRVWRVGGYGKGTNPIQFLEPRDVAVDQSNGDIFVVDNANNRVVRLASDGTQPFVWSGSPKLSSPIGIGVEGGLVYVAEGGKSDIRVFSESGTDVQTIADATKGSPCFLKQSRDVDADSSGNIYVANYEQNNIVVFGPDGTCLYSYGTKGTGPKQFKNPYGIKVGSDPNLPGQTAVWVADSNNNRVEEYTAGTGTLNFQQTIGGPGNYNQPGTFTNIRRVTVDSQGNVWGSDLWGYRVEEWQDTSGGYQYAQTIGAVPPPLTDNAVFNQVRQVGFDSSGNLYAIDTVNQRFVEMTSTGSVTGACGLRGFMGVGQFNWPRGLAVDPGTGEIWVADTKQSDIQILNPDCSPVAKFGKAGPALGNLNWPMSLAIRSSDGTVWVADSKNNRVDVFSLSAPYTALATFGSLGSGTGQFHNPQGIAIDPTTGNILVADANNNRVVELSAGSGATGISVVAMFTDRFKSPAGVAVDGSGNIAVADTGHSQVKGLSPAGAAEWTLTGPTSGTFNQPMAVAYGPNGDLYVSDTINDVIDVFGDSPL